MRQAAPRVEGGGNLAVSAPGVEVCGVFVELVAFGGEVGAYGVLVVEVKEVDGLRDDAENACRTVVFPPGGSDARVVDGEQDDAVAVVAGIVSVCTRQAAGDGSEVVQFGYVHFEAFLMEEGSISRILEEVGAVIAPGSGVGRDTGAQDAGTGGVVCAHGEVRVCPCPQPAAAVVRVGAEAAGGEGVAAEGEDAGFLVNTLGGSGVGKALQGGLFVEGEDGVLFEEGGHGVSLL